MQKVTIASRQYSCKWGLIDRPQVQLRNTFTSCLCISQMLSVMDSTVYPLYAVANSVVTHTRSQDFRIFPGSEFSCILKS